MLCVPRPMLSPHNCATLSGRQHDRAKLLALPPLFSSEEQKKDTFPADGDRNAAELILVSSALNLPTERGAQSFIQVRGIWNYVSYSMFLCLVFSETDHKIFKFSMFSRELPFSHIAYQFTVQVRE